MRKREIELNEKQMRLYHQLEAQANKIFNFKTHIQGKRGTERYRGGVRPFLRFCAAKFGLRNIRNISDKHIAAFIEYSREANVAVSTLKTDLSAIRKLHEMIPNSRYRLSENHELNYTDQRKTRGVDRAWRDSEVKHAVNLAHQMNRYDVKWSIQLARNCGLRIEEVTALTKTQLRNALQKGYLELRTTKGGIPRDVPVSPEARNVFREILAHATQEKIFIRHGKQHHQAFKSIQNWIYNHREYFQESYQRDEGYIRDLRIDEERADLTFHGLRHAYAREQYEQRIGSGMSPSQARKEVAGLLGHGRDDVTRIYLGK